MKNTVAPPLGDNEKNQQNTRKPKTGENLGKASSAHRETILNAEEIMAKHKAQAPSEENGFSLKDIVATEQAVPVNPSCSAIVSCRKPTQNEFIRVTHNPDKLAVIDMLEDDENTRYIVTLDTMSEIKKLHESTGKMVINTKRVVVHLAVNMSGDSFLWPIAAGNVGNTWSDSARQCALIAQDTWIRIISNRPCKRYDYHNASKNADVEPQWPQNSFIEMLNLAFKGKLIRSLEHPVIKQLLDK